MNNLNLNKLRSFAEYCGELWCEWHIFIVNETTLYFTTNASKWIVHLTDYEKFGRYILWHYSANNNDNKYHKQNSFGSIYNAVASAYAHDFHKEYLINFSKEDFDRLKEDFNRMYI